MKELMTALKTVAPGMAKKDVRYYLNGMLLEFTLNKLTLVSTTGHHLIAVEMDCMHDLEGFDDNHPVQFIVEEFDVNKLLKLFEMDSDIEITQNGENLIFTNGKLSYEVEPIDGNYPNYRQVIPKPCKDSLAGGALEMGINADYLALACKALKPVLSKEFSGMRMHYSGSSNSLLFEAQIPDSFKDITSAQVVVMPMRL